jgi:ubiquinone/menaquinone biosynthesis C-methylase UbiE
MLVITSEGVSGLTLREFGYIKKRGIIGRLILPITRWLRAINVERYIDSGNRILDIGCGDGYFLKRLSLPERYGLDKRLGDDVREKLNFPDEYFDYITMLAVIEHIDNKSIKPLVNEIYRTLKPGGKFIFTTPKRSAEFLIHLYVKDIEEEHETYYDPASVRKLAADLFEVSDYKTFIFGLNQVFCLTRR